jgi:hypothetical protein
MISKGEIIGALVASAASALMRYVSHRLDISKPRPGHDASSRRYNAKCRSGYDDSSHCQTSLPNLDGRGVSSEPDFPLLSSYEMRLCSFDTKTTARNWAASSPTKASAFKRFSMFASARMA